MRCGEVSRSVKTLERVGDGTGIFGLGYAGALLGGLPRLSLVVLCVSGSYYGTRLCGPCQALFANTVGENVAKRLPHVPFV